MSALRLSVATFRHGTRLKVAFIAAVYLDVALTYLARAIGFTELNPVMASLLEDPERLLLVKGMFPVALAWLVPDRLLLPSVAFMIGVAGWNLSQFAAGL